MLLMCWKLSQNNSKVNIVTPRRLQRPSSDTFRNLSSELYDHLGTVLIPCS